MKRSTYKRIIILFTVILFCIIYIFSQKLPMQKLKITAITTAKNFNISGTTNLYYFKSAPAGESCTAIIEFMAVENKSKNLFTFYGKGQYIYLGCSKLQAKYDFISFDRFINVRLTLNAAESELKLEDGTPFDITRYSLKPVIIIEE